MQTDPATASHAQGVLIIDDTGNRKEGKKTAHVSRQYLGSVGKTDNGIAAVSSLWAERRIRYPLRAQPYTPASRLVQGQKDPAFRTKPQIAVELVQAAAKCATSGPQLGARWRVLDQLGRQFVLGPKRRGVGNPSGLPALPILRAEPHRRPVQPPIDQRVAIAARVAEEYADLAIVLFARMAAPLTGHPGQVAPLLGEITAVDDQDAVLFPEALVDQAPMLGQERVNSGANGAS